MTPAFVPRDPGLITAPRTSVGEGAGAATPQPFRPRPAASDFARPAAQRLLPAASGRDCADGLLEVVTQFVWQPHFTFISLNPDLRLLSQTANGNSARASKKDKISRHTAVARFISTRRSVHELLPQGALKKNPEVPTYLLFGDFLRFSGLILENIFSCRETAKKRDKKNRREKTTAKFFIRSTSSAKSF
jgi:hypothetical protein